MPRGTLVAVDEHSIAHDLNNHLTTILGHAELLERRLCDEELLCHTREILAAARLAGLLTRRLMNG